MKAVLIDKNDFEGFVALEDGTITTISLSKLNNINISSSLSYNTNLTSFNPIANHSNPPSSKLNYF